MSVICALLLVPLFTTADGLDDARLLVQRGLLRQAEQRLEPLLADELDVQRRARMLLLLGNVDYERGLYAQALERYAQAERDAGGDASLGASARGNRLMAEQRLQRSREIAGQVARLRECVAAVALLAGGAVVWLARKPHAAASLETGPR